MFICSHAVQRERQLSANFCRHGAQERLLAHQQRRTLRPTGRNIREHQRLYKTGARRGPHCERPDRLRLSPAPDTSSRRTSVPGFRRSALATGRHRWRPPSSRILPSALSIVDALPASSFAQDFRSQAHVTVAFHRLDQERQQRFQPLAADPVGCLTKHYQRISLSFLVIRRRVRRTEDCLISPRSRRIACFRCKPVTSTNWSRIRASPRGSPLCSAAPQRPSALSPNRHAQLPHYRARSPIPLGSKLREAGTAQHSGTFQPTSCHPRMASDRDDRP
ncbi:hypothetical protein ACVWZ6_003026 [Bradyrhizobium sp. GM6.1]